MKERTIVIDPLTRIEGHLRIEATINDKGQIVQALSSGTQVRGIETILQGRDPRDAWAFAQRICGVCTLVHGLASVRAVEDALSIKIPENAELIRNLMAGCQMLQDHVMHFYHLQALDWVSPVAALKADPAVAAQLAQRMNYPVNDIAHFTSVQTRISNLVSSGQLGIFTNGWWDHPGYSLPPEINLILISHYLDGLAWQREIGKVMTIFGGKDPHPNLVVGGVPCAISSGNDELPGGGDGTAVNLSSLARVQQLITQMKEFVERVYLPDLVLLGQNYPEWFKRGEGVRNFMAYSDLGIHTTGGSGVPSGVVLDRNLDRLHSLDLADPEQVQEFVSHSWYTYRDGPDAGLHPYDGETDFHYDGPRPPFENLDKNASYSWIKSPRWRGKPVEVGPLARLVLLHAGQNQPAIDFTSGILAQLDQPFDALYSTLGRIVARGIESKLLAERMQGWFDRLMGNVSAGDVHTFDGHSWHPRDWPAQCQGIGYVEAPRGALAHWVVIENGKIANYQAVVPTTWNAGPADSAGQNGPYEAALLDRHMLERPDEPLEVLRTIHSFDPCLACAAHVLGPGNEAIVQVKVV
ncbi:nickel-dependent hydrogenase large subunit [Aquicoccus sp. SU-CL01552]|uniref:nickel-dependent hydrogenase large subunit n=1 Tax=Aquicoccus sp. SU-CL01552 TaxID=3127656 RepID=UPI0031046569